MKETKRKQNRKEERKTTIESISGENHICRLVSSKCQIQSDSSTAQRTSRSTKSFNICTKKI